MWWLRHYAARRGNIYPTHGLGPVCQIMNINRGDRLDFLVSMESNDFMMAKKAKELAARRFLQAVCRQRVPGQHEYHVIRTRRGARSWCSTTPPRPRRIS